MKQYSIQGRISIDLKSLQLLKSFPRYRLLSDLGFQIFPWKSLAFSTTSYAPEIHKTCISKGNVIWLIDMIYNIHNHWYTYRHTYIQTIPGDQLPKRWELKQTRTSFREGVSSIQNYWLPFSILINYCNLFFLNPKPPKSIQLPLNNMFIPYYSYFPLLFKKYIKYIIVKKNYICHLQITSK